MSPGKKIEAYWHPGMLAGVHNARILNLSIVKNRISGIVQKFYPLTIILYFTLYSLFNGKFETKKNEQQNRKLARI